MTERYDVYPSQGDPDLPWELRPEGSSESRESGEGGGSGTSGPWRVLVEYSNGGQAKPPTLVRVSTEDYPTREQAQAAALATARAYDPPDPLSPKSRLVYREVDGNYLTVIHGAMSVFHFTTRIVCFVEEL